MVSVITKLILFTAFLFVVPQAQAEENKGTIEFIKPIYPTNVRPIGAYGVGINYGDWSAGRVDSGRYGAKINNAGYKLLDYEIVENLSLVASGGGVYIEDEYTENRLGGYLNLPSIVADYSLFGSRVISKIGRGGFYFIKTPAHSFMAPFVAARGLILSKVLEFDNSIYINDNNYLKIGASAWFDGRRRSIVTAGAGIEL